MPDPSQLTPIPGLLESIERELRPVAQTAVRARELAYRCREQLIEIAGQSGHDGQLGRIREDIARITTSLDVVEAASLKHTAELIALRLERRALTRAGALGATGGGAIVVGFVEVLKLLLGG